jgi:hypothetical protein
VTVAPRLRRARQADVPAIVAIKQALRLEPGGGGRGGFLLGCSAERYAQLIEVAEVIVLEERGEVTGFAIALPDPVLRASELWKRSERILWKTGEGEPPLTSRISYFDQLALSPLSPRFHAAALALASLQDLIASSHDYLYATTVVEPIRNSAALPILSRIGARPVGRVEEEYEEVGRVVSELHQLDLRKAQAVLANAPLGRRVAAAQARPAQKTVQNNHINPPGGNLI